MKPRMLIALLALLGSLLALYLTLYKLGIIGQLVCQMGSCETVNTSRWSTFLGLPVAAWGFMTYAALLGLSLFGLQDSRDRAPAVSIALVAISGWSVLFSSWLTYLELFVIHAICMYCVTSAVLMVMIFATSVVDLRTVREDG